jgi:hypothetical protein
VNLKGSLDAFGLPDVVTLLASTGKTGGLQLRRDVTGLPVAGVVWFREGRVSGASSDRSRASLVRRVVGSGAVDDAALRHAVQRAQAGGVGVARALLDAGAVDPDLLREAASEQTIDAVFDLLRWPDGDFCFDPEAEDTDDVGISLDPAHVLGEARARNESWSRLEALVPSPDSILTVPVVLEHDPSVSRDEWALLALVDGRRRVRDLVELTGAGQFAITTTLAHLVQRGLLRVVDAATPDHVAIVERRLALLAGVEETDEAAAPASAPAAAPPVPPARIADTGPVGPGSFAITAADARKAMEAAQTPGAGGLVRPAARQEVVPPRPEPFLPDRRPEHPEPVYAESAVSPRRPAPGPGASLAGSLGSTSVIEGATARSLSEPVTTPVPSADGVIERDPAVNRSLLLRLIAGVRGL